MSGVQEPTRESMIERLSVVLDVFEGPEPALTLTEIASRAGLPRSTTHRMLEQMVGVRWVQRTGDHYQLGMRMLELGGLVASRHRLRAAALPHLEELQRMTGNTVHLAVLDRTEAVYLDKLGCRFGRDLPTRIGGRQPVHCTAVGKALLAYQGDDAISAVARGPLERRTTRTIVDGAVLVEELAHVRDAGFALDRGESINGVACVATPLRGSGRAIAALSVCGPAETIDPDTLAPTLATVARATWRSMFGS